MGEIYGQSILKVEETEIIPFSRTTLHLTEDQIQFNKSYVSMVKTVLDTPYFYFSYTYDITHTLQSLYNSGPDFTSKSLFERVSQLFLKSFVSILKLFSLLKADKRFVWNNCLLSEFGPKLDSYRIPVMHGRMYFIHSLSSLNTFTDVSPKQL